MRGGKQTLVCSRTVHSSTVVQHLKKQLNISIVLTFVLLLSCNTKQKKIDTWNSRISEFENEKLVITPGVGTEKYVVGQTPIRTILAELGEYDKFTQGITDLINAEAEFTNRYIFSKHGITFITHTPESKGQDIENAIVKTIIFTEKSRGELDNGIAIGDGLEKLNTRLGEHDDQKDVYSNVTHFSYSKKGIRIIVDDNTKRIIEFVIYQPRE